MQNLLNSLEEPSQIGFTNYTANNKANYAVAQLFSYNSHATINGGCHLDTSEPMPQVRCKSEVDADSVICTESSDQTTYQLNFTNSSGASAKFTVTNKNVTHGDLKIMYGKIIDYPGPYHTCTEDDPECGNIM